MRARWVFFFFFLSFSLDALEDEEKIKTNFEMPDGKSIELEEIDESKIQVDGHLNEAVWKELPFYDEFVVIEPDSLKKPLYSTRVKIFYDSSGLYFGIDMDQPKETLVRRLSGRDAGLMNRDSININLDIIAHLFNGPEEWRWSTKIFFLLLSSRRSIKKRAGV